MSLQTCYRIHKFNPFIVSSKSSNSGGDLPKLKRRLGPGKTTIGNDNGLHNCSALDDCHDSRLDEQPNESRSGALFGKFNIQANQYFPL